MAVYCPQSAMSLEQVEHYLGEEDLKDVLNYLNGVTHKWKIIGVQLGLPIGKLDAIASSEPDIEGKLLETVKAWLQGNFDEAKSGKPTWSRLAMAVDQTNKSAAKRIKNHHMLLRISKSCDDLSCRIPIKEEQYSPISVRSSTGSSRVSLPLEESTNERSPSSSWLCFPWRKKKNPPKASQVSRISTQYEEVFIESGEYTILRKATNPRTCLVKDMSYHGIISGREAERRLLGKKEKCYLTRYSTRQTCYVLSVRFLEGRFSTVKHFKICDEDMIWVDSEDKMIKFQTLQELTSYYTENPLTHESYSTIGAICPKP